MNLIFEIRLGLGLSDLGLGLTLINHKPNSNLISRIKFVYLGFSEHGIITSSGGRLVYDLLCFQINFFLVSC